ncbi:hypothetical protein BV20DRAFT_236415 [Pilatotrama ljubarskyi]|nr:hypothetical protein BV20DRAFT_236415 [Pilatotrama ljubarskyi]
MRRVPAIGDTRIPSTRGVHCSSARTCTLAQAILVPLQRQCRDWRGRQCPGAGMSRCRLGVVRDGVRLLGRAGGIRISPSHSGISDGQTLCYCIAQRGRESWVKHCIVTAGHRFSPSIRRNPLGNDAIDDGVFIAVQNGSGHCDAWCSGCWRDPPRSYITSRYRGAVKPHRQGKRAGKGMHLWMSMSSGTDAVGTASLDDITVP